MQCRVFYFLFIIIIFYLLKFYFLFFNLATYYITIACFNYF